MISASKTGMSRGARRVFAVLCASLALAAPGDRPARADDDAVPARVVSINLCTDQLLLALGGRNQAVSLSFLAADPDVSNTADEAAGLPLNRGLAEEVLAADPDLVLAGTATTHATVRLLDRLGIAVESFAIADDLDAVRRQILRVAVLIGRPYAGVRMAAALEAEVAAVRSRAGAARPSVLVYSGRGFTAGAGTLVGDLLDRLGFVNFAAAAGISGYGSLPLEDVVAEPPDILVIGADYEESPSLAWQFLRHPALRAAVGIDRIVIMPTRLWTCPGPWLAEVGRRLSAMRDRRGATGS